MLGKFDSTVIKTKIKKNENEGTLVLGNYLLGINKMHLKSTPGLFFVVYIYIGSRATSRESVNLGLPTYANGMH